MKLKFEALLNEFLKRLKTKDEFLIASLFSLFSSILSQGGSFLSFMLLARQMGGYDFGTFSIIFSSVLFVSVVSIFGGTIPLTKQLAELHQNGDYKNAKRLTRYSFLISTFLLALISVYSLSFKADVAEFFLGSAQLSKHLNAFLVLLCSYTFYNMQTSIFMGLKAYKEYFYSSLGRFVFSFSPVLGYYFFDLDKSIFFFALGFFASSLLNLALLSRKEKQLQKDYANTSNTHHKLTFKDYLSKIGVYVIPFFLSSLLAYLVAWLTNRILVGMPNGYNELGKFNSIFQLRTFILFIPNAIGSVVLPIIAAAFVREDLDNVRKTYKQFFWGTCAIATIVTLSMIVFSEIIISFLGSKYDLSNYLITVIALAIFMATIQSVYGVFLNSIGKMWTGFALNLIWAIALVVLFVALPFRNRLDGALNLAYSYFFSYAFIWLIEIILINYYLKNLINYRKK